jgi:hypothetical protein
MTETPKNLFAQEQSSDQPITLRYLIDDPILGWRTFPMAKATSAYRGELLLPEWAGRTVRVVLAVAILKGRRIHHLQRIEPSEWKFDSEGRVDQDEVMRRIQKHVNSATGETAATGVATRRLSDADISAIRRCLKLPERGS